MFNVIHTSIRLMVLGGDSCATILSVHLHYPVLHLQ